MWGSDHISRYSNEFVEWITDSNLVLLNTTVPTYRSSAGISLDIKSAYDSVYVDGLIYKCLQIGIAGNIANWIHKFLPSRSFQIKWRGYFSPKKLVPQGLAQGSVLSPILYTIYMHDIFETLESEVECLVYALLFTPKVPSRKREQKIDLHFDPGFCRVAV
ncbi:RNA-directed DNA polymerase from mobile element jockey [Trichonephila clavipes]|nr:RNA-directed DNA polymerase from mobile element jockey [Trichonephila clavipes]